MNHEEIDLEIIFLLFLKEKFFNCDSLELIVKMELWNN